MFEIRALIDENSAKYMNAKLFKTVSVLEQMQKSKVSVI